MMIAAIVAAASAISALASAAGSWLTATLLRAPQPIRPWVITAIVLDALLIWATFERRSPIGGWIVARGRSDTPAVAVTFDDGPTEPYTSQILDVLKSFDAHATFFVLGARAEASPTVVRRAAAEGHEIGNHGWDHAALPLRGPGPTRATIRRTSELVERAAGVRPRVFRAPFGWRNPWTDTSARREGCEPVAWTVGVYDTDRPGATAIADRAIAGLANGAILLLHDGRSLDPAPDASQVVEALPRILTEARRRGLRLLTVSEMLAESRRSGR